MKTEITPIRESWSIISLGDNHRLQFYPNLGGFVLQKKSKFLWFTSWPEEGTDNVYFSDVNDGICYFRKYIEPKL